MRRANAEDETSATDAPPTEPKAQTCVACGEPITEIVEARPEYCFVCAVHVVCACADQPDPR